MRPLRRGGEPLHGLAAVLCHAPSIRIAEREPELRVRIPLVCREAIPACGFRLVVGSVVPELVHLAKGELGSSVSLQRQLGPVLARRHLRGIRDRGGCNCGSRHDRLFEDTRLSASRPRQENAGEEANADLTNHSLDSDSHPRSG